MLAQNCSLLTAHFEWAGIKSENEHFLIMYYF